LISSVGYGTVPFVIFLDDALVFLSGDASLRRGKLVALVVSAGRWISIGYGTIPMTHWCPRTEKRNWLMVFDS
jgi:hypothetical protein